jgi:hypothetical protein
MARKRVNSSRTAFSCLAGAPGATWMGERLVHRHTRARKGLGGFAYRRYTRSVGGLLVGNGGGRGGRLEQFGGGPGHAGAFYEAAPPSPRAESNPPEGRLAVFGGRAGRATGYTHVACWAGAS